MRADLGGEVFDESAAVPRVGDHGGDADQAHGLFGGLAAFDEQRFFVAAILRMA